MSAEDITVTIARVRRMMPRNGAVMTICEEVEKLRARLRTETERLRAEHLAEIDRLQAQLDGLTRPKVDRKTYMRTYMQKYRKRADAASA
jgi:hypothetical protein